MDRSITGGRRTAAGRSTATGRNTAAGRSTATGRNTAAGMIVDGFDAFVNGVCAKGCVRNVTRDGGVRERIFFLGPDPHDLKIIGGEYLQWMSC